MQANAPFMKDPMTTSTNLIVEGLYLILFEKYDELINRYEEKKYLLESANQGITKYYHETIAIAYRETGNFKKKSARGKGKGIFLRSRSQ